MRRIHKVVEFYNTLDCVAVLATKIESDKNSLPWQSKVLVRETEWANFHGLHIVEV